jgi:multiple sugar transport system substrate-binding protein
VKKNKLSLTVVILIMMLLSACSGGGTNTGPGQSTAEGGSESSSSGITLTIAVTKSELFFDALKQKFEASHPGVTVNIKEYITSTIDKSAQGAMQQIERDMEKYVTTVTTEMASGRGPDLLVTNYLPYKKYADKHMLADISKLMADDSSFDSSKYFTNVFDTMKYKGGLYAIPTSVQFTNLWMGDSSLLGGAKIDDNTWSWQDFADLTKPLIPQGGTALGGIPADRLLLEMLNPGIDQFVDSENKKASFDSPEFKNLLTQAKTMIDEGIVTGSMEDMFAAGKNGGMGLFEANGFRYLDEFVLAPIEMFNGKGAIYRAPSMTPNQGYSFRSNLTLSINDKSKNMEMAWEFLKLALSEEIQTDRSKNGMRGMPVNKDAFHQLLEDLKDPELFGKGGKDGKGGTIQLENGRELTVPPVTQEQLDKIESYMTGIRSVQETDDKIFSLIQSETEPFFSGQKSVDDVAKSIQNKVETYLNE